MLPRHSRKPVLAFSCPYRAGTLVALTLLLLASASAPAGAQEPDEAVAALLERLQGVWQGSGQINGMTSSAEMRWGTALGGAFRTQELVHRFDGGASFEGRGYYAVDGSQAVWVDSGRSIHTVVLTAEGDALQADWGTRGRTVYELEGDALEVVDSIRAGDGGWREFGRATYRRMPEAATGSGARSR